MANPAQSPQKDDSACAVHCSQGYPASEPPVQRPTFNVPIDLGYSIQRFADPHTHVEDRALRPLQLFTGVAPLTEDQSRARMAGILAAITIAPPPAPN
ncbi:hypothetical protein SAMD00023353_8000440 [Rosellinia necatrix]|uniref:Uncharacterized protein n=1 Tax=Rosellinia necatrix TaxID=77044 RepID=A0A1W2TUQ1_ROSNE|nr:hypothetical protein SAMD00023353_8000440 [Rosellinia necatrix]